MFDSAQSGIAKERLRGHSLPLTGQSQRLKRNIEADLIAKFEAIRHTFFGSIHSDLDFFNRMSLYPFGIRSPGHEEHASRWMVESWITSPPRQRNMDFMRNLSCDAVKGQGRDQADHSLRNATRYDDEIRLARLWQIGQPIHSASHRNEPARVAKPVENTGVDTQLQGARGPQYAAMAPEDGFGLAVRLYECHGG